MAEFKTNRKHMTASNLHKGKALVNDYSKDYQPSYMKATTVTKPGNLASGGDKLYKSIGPDMGRDARTSKSDGNSVPGKKAITKTRTGPGRVTERQEGYTLNYSDSPKYKSKKKQTIKKKTENKKKKDKLGRSEGVPHYGTMMAKKLMGGNR